MIQVTLVGGGSAITASSEVLSRAGFQVRHAADLQWNDRSPVILGETQSAFTIARQAVQDGRHLLIACPAALPVDRLSLLYSERKHNQAVFVWSERRYHPGFRFMSSLIESDSDWRPRYLRQETLGQEPTTSQLIQWRALESIAVLLGIADELPMSVAAAAVDNPVRNAPDLYSLTITFKRMRAFLQVGQGEALERRETLLAATTRKAYIDEVNPNAPLRLVEDETKARTGEDRWISCPTPSTTELARQQCLSFLDGTIENQIAHDEARLWSRALATLSAMERSIQSEGAPLGVIVEEDKPRFRLIPNRSATPPSVA